LLPIAAERILKWRHTSGAWSGAKRREKILTCPSTFFALQVAYN